LSVVVLVKKKINIEVVFVSDMEAIMALPKRTKIGCKTKVGFAVWWIVKPSY
jgi:hypothetical protein